MDECVAKPVRRGAVTGELLRVLVETQSQSGVPPLTLDAT